MNELKIIKEQEEKVNKNKMLYRGYKNTYDFTKFYLKRTFGMLLKVVLLR